MNNRGNKQNGYLGMLLLTVLVLAVSTFLLVLIGRKLLQHENNQTARIEYLEKEKGILNTTIVEKDTTIDDLNDKLKKAEKRIESLEDVYSLTSGKLDSLLETQKELEKRIEEAEKDISSVSSAVKDNKKTDTDKKDTDKKDTDKKDTDKTDTSKDETETTSTYKSVYQKIISGEDIKLLIIGDSIGLPMDDTSWVVLLKNWLEKTYSINVSVNNVSMSGNTSYAGYARTMLLPEGDSYDLAIICYGHNDYDFGFENKYELIIRAVEKRFPNCSMISILQSSQKDYTSKIRVIQSLSKYYDIPVADTIKAYSSSGMAYSDLSPDGIHPEGYGRELYFNTLRDIVKEKIEKNEPRVYQERSASYCEWKNYDKVAFVDKSKWERIDIYTYVYSKQVSGYMGVYYSKVSDNTGFAIYADGKEFYNGISSWNSSTLLPYITQPINEKVTAKKEIRIVFGSEETANTFEGLIVSK